jgi:VanZ family protein
MQFRENTESCNPSGLKITILAVYMVLILLSSLIPMDRDIEGLKFIIQLKPVIQNLLHVPMFALLAILFLQVLDSFDVPGFWKFLIVAFAAVAFGIFNELIQLWVPGRYAGLLDMGLNAIGVLLGILLYVFAARSRPNLLRRLVCG